MRAISHRGGIRMMRTRKVAVAHLAQELEVSEPPGRRGAAPTNTGVELATAKTDQPCARSGCRWKLNALTVSEGDEFCSSLCARIHFDVPSLVNYEVELERLKLKERKVVKESQTKEIPGKTYAREPKPYENIGARA